MNCDFKVRPGTSRLTKKNRNRERKETRSQENKKKGVKKKGQKGSTGGSVEVVDPAGNGLSEGGRDDGGTDDGQRDAAALLQQQVLGQRFRVRVRVGTLANQPALKPTKESSVFTQENPVILGKTR